MKRTEKNGSNENVKAEAAKAQPEQKMEPKAVAYNGYCIARSFHEAGRGAGRARFPSRIAMGSFGNGAPDCSIRK